MEEGEPEGKKNGREYEGQIKMMYFYSLQT